MSRKVLSPRVLVIADFYLPNFQGAGHVRSIASLIERMGDEFQFFVLCRDWGLTNSRSSQQPKPPAWVTVGKAKVKYLSPDQLSLLNLRSLLRGIDFDLLYLNGYFSPFTRLILMMRLLGLLPKKRIVLVPHGEFAGAALSLKRYKKWIYSRIARMIGLYDNLIWHATSEPEGEDIRRELRAISKTGDDQVIMAPNLPGCGD